MAIPIRSQLHKSPVLKRKLHDLPRGPGCYLYRDQENSLLYIGKAKCIKKRVKSYFSNKQLDSKTKRLVSKIWDIEFLLCSSEIEALVLENNHQQDRLPNQPDWTMLTWNDYAHLGEVKQYGQRF